MKPPVRAGGGRRTERYRGARRKRTRLPFAGVGKPERPRNPSAYKTPGSIEPPGEGARDEATLPGRRQAVLEPPQGAGRKWRAFGPPDMFSRAARPSGPPREFCWRPGPRQWPAASRRLWGCSRLFVGGFSWEEAPEHACQALDSIRQASDRGGSDHLRFLARRRHPGVETRARLTRRRRFTILGPMPEDERWQFPPGSRVLVPVRDLSGGSCLVATEPVGST
jgi:hypothetical protein